MANKTDLIGKRFGRLKVTSFGYTSSWNSYWECVCDCGKEVYVRRGNLISGNSKSCGCLNEELKTKRKMFDDISGKVFGIMMAIEMVGKDERNNAKWRARCIKCGKERISLAANLKGGTAQSCPCQERIRPAMHKIEEAGQRYGMLEIIRYEGTDEDQLALWVCQLS